MRHLFALNYNAELFRRFLRIYSDKILKIGEGGGGGGGWGGGMSRKLVSTKTRCICTYANYILPLCRRFGGPLDPPLQDVKILNH